jgi:hypothetical protein
MQTNHTESLHWVKLLDSLIPSTDDQSRNVSQGRFTVKSNHSNLEFSFQEIIAISKKIIEGLGKDCEEGRINKTRFEALSSKVCEVTNLMAKHDDLDNLESERNRTYYPRAALYTVSIATYLVGGFYIYRALNQYDKKYEEKKQEQTELLDNLLGINNLLGSIDDHTVGEKSVRELFSGKDIRLDERKVQNAKGETISVIDTFYKDFMRADYYLDGISFKRETPEENLTKLKDSFAPQQLKNITLVLNQASLANPLARQIEKYTSEGLLPMTGSHLEYRIERIKKDNLVRLTIITELKVNQLADMEGEAKGHIGYAAEIYISEEELNQDWIGQKEVAPAMTVVDCFSPLQKTPQEAIISAKQASEILKSSFVAA